MQQYITQYWFYPASITFLALAMLSQAGCYFLSSDRQRFVCKFGSITFPPQSDPLPAEHRSRAEHVLGVCSGVFVILTFLTCFIAMIA